MNYQWIISNVRLYQLNPKRTWRELEDVILQDTETLIASCESTSEDVLFEWLRHANRVTNLKIYDISSELTVMLKGLLSNSENREHLKNFRNVDCVLANHNKVQDMWANLETTN